MKPSCRWLMAALLTLAVLASAESAAADPFSFLARPTDQLGVAGYAAGSEITPEGSIYTGWAELAFRFGPELRPAEAPARELVGGRYPVVRYWLRAAGVSYTVTVLSAGVGGRPVDFARVLLRNGRSRPVRACWGAALRYSGGSLLRDGTRAFRFVRPEVPLREGLLTQPGAAFDPASVWAFDGDAVTRDGQALLLFPAAPPGFTRSLSPYPAGAAAPVEVSTRFGQVNYCGRLAPHAERQLDFTMPVEPVSPGSADFAAIASAGFRTELANVLAYWRNVYAAGIQLRLPERKVEDTFYASIANMSMSRYPAATAPGWVQTVNKLQYNAFWLRDAAVIANAFDLAGLHDLARQDLEFFPAWQRSDGLFISRSDQYDGFGEALWALGQHAVRTQDAAFAAEMLGPVRKAMDWFERDRASEPLGMLPAASPGDDEYTSGHIVGDDFWAAAGIREAIALAGLAGRDDLGQRWSADLDSFLTDLRARLAEAEARTGGWIPPALEANGGEDWGNLWAAYPDETLAPDDPAVSATLRHALSRFREGIATFFNGTVLHGYLGFRVFETELLRGEQRAVVQGLYSELAHTTATGGGFETGVRRGGPRALAENLAPHGWFAAEYVTLLRNMLVRENGTDLLLMSAVPPAWLRPGRHFSLTGADTSLGPISYTLRAIRGGAVLSWDARPLPGTRLLWTVPSAAHHVRAPGLSADRTTIALPAAAGSLRVRWRLSGPFPSFRATVKSVMAHYRHHRRPGRRR